MSALLTVVTITWNAERYLPRTLESARAALDKLDDPTTVEYLIIDGGSGDATLDIAGRYPFISKIISEKDRGLYDAMNKGQRLATGKYVWFLNAGDEMYDADVLAKLAPLLRQHPDVAFSDAMFVREDGTEVGLRSKFTPHSLPEKLTWEDFALGMKVCHQAFIARTAIAPEYDCQNLSADIDWEIECLKASHKTLRLDFLLCKYLLGGVSVQSHRRSLTDRFQVLRKHFGLFPALFNHARIFWRGFWFVRRNGKYW